MNDTIPQPPEGGEHAADRMTPAEYEEWSADAGEDDETPEHAEFRQFRSEAFRESLTTDSLAQSLETRVLELEAVAAARWPRRALLAWRLGRALRGSVRHIRGDTFQDRRTEAAGIEWLAR
jgi:hypothetical protein